MNLSVEIAAGKRSLTLANPVMAHPPVNTVFQNNGPAVDGSLLPFLFICITFGAISGFHSLVVTGIAPKLVKQESHIRSIGYGSMIMEGLIAVTALIATAAIPAHLYYEMNVPGGDESKYQTSLTKLYGELGVPKPTVKDAQAPMQISDPKKLNLAQLETLVGGEHLRGRTGGVATFATGFAITLTQALEWTAWPIAGLMKYWYHFALVFMALFIFAMLDAGTRMGRYFLQDAFAGMFPQMGELSSLPGLLFGAFCALLVTLGWTSVALLAPMETMWSMLGVLDLLFAVAGLTVAVSVLKSLGKTGYAMLVLVSMLLVAAAATYGGVLQIWQWIHDDNWPNISIVFFQMLCIAFFLLTAVVRLLTAKRAV